MFDIIIGIAVGGAAVWFAKPTLQAWIAAFKAMV